MTTPTRPPQPDNSPRRSMPAQHPTTMLTRSTQFLHPVRWSRYPISELSNAHRRARTTLFAAIRRGLEISTGFRDGRGASCRGIAAVGLQPADPMLLANLATRHDPRPKANQPAGLAPAIVPSPREQRNRRWPDHKSTRRVKNVGAPSEPRAWGTRRSPSSPSRASSSLAGAVLLVARESAASRSHVARNARDFGSLAASALPAPIRPVAKAPNKPAFDQGVFHNGRVRLRESCPALMAAQRGRESRLTGLESSEGGDYLLLPWSSQPYSTQVQLRRTCPSNSCGQLRPRGTRVGVRGPTTTGHSAGGSGPECDPQNQLVHHLRRS
jgi:hypothetical protein